MSDSQDNVAANVQEYYGQSLQCQGDLKSIFTSCKKKPDEMSIIVKDALKSVHEDVVNKYYGCGLPIPDVLEGLNVLDLGCGSGRDCYILSKLTGRNGHVTGVDMTSEQIAVANKYVDYHTKSFGYTTPNVTFVKGYIEKLKEVGLQDGIFDLIVSNCVINLCADKAIVFQEISRVLKEGGEFYFSDMYANKPVPEAIQKNPQMWGEGYGGALPWSNFIQILSKVGLHPRLVSVGNIVVTDNETKSLLEKHGENTQYLAATYRLFKLPKETCSPHIVTYLGTISGKEYQFKFDNNTIFKTNEKVLLDGLTTTALKTSRYHKHFTFESSNDSSALICETENPFEVLENNA